VDEAHHVAARTWADTREVFADRPVVQFTATPFREDGKHVEGQIVYDFPLSEAQRQHYFAPINYTSVIDFIDTDRELARRAVEQLGQDVDAGLDHQALGLTGAQRQQFLLQRLIPVGRVVAEQRQRDRVEVRVQVVAEALPRVAAVERPEDAAGLR
jgi:superfamily II DNA or RNA helicase